MNERMNEIENIALSSGLDPFPVVFEVVEQGTMNNICSYGLPARARHWSYGRSYSHQKTYGEMGLSKIYEIIINNNPSYAFMLDTNSKVQNLFINAHCQGHCFVPGTLVETLGGPKPVEQLDLNDKLLTHTGVYRNPIALSKRFYKGNIIQFYIGSSSVRCTSEHPFLVVRHEKCTIPYRKSICRPNCKYKGQHVCKNKKPYKQYNAEWVKAEDIREGDFAVYPKSKIIGCEPVKEIKISGTKGKGHPGGVKTVEYNVPIDEDFGEFLGLYLAEGYARPGGQMGLCFNTSEQMLHNKSRELVNKLFELKCYNSIQEKTHSHQILFNEKVLASWLLDNVGKGSKNKHIPDFLIRGSNEEFLVGLLRGVFHGDGHSSVRQFVFTTISPLLAMQVKQICATLNIKINIKLKKHENKQDAYCLFLTGTSMMKFSSKTGVMWDTNNGNRSWEFCWYDEDNVYIPFKKVSSSCEKTFVYNLEVPKDSSYTLFAGAVTHNSDFFKNNIMFKNSDRNMISHAAEHAGRVEEYIEKYGFERVEHLMDIGFSLSRHIDWHKGLYRKPYPKRDIRVRRRKDLEFDDLLVSNPGSSIIKEVINSSFPPHPEKGLLWFLINHAPLEEWEKDVLEMMREESFYFYPQMMTKIMNEGWASYWHAEIMYKYNGLSPDEHLDFCRDHERVVQPGGNPFRINPYFLGYKIFIDIEKRWDEKYGKGAGKKKIFEVRSEEDDVSFLRNYLTAELIDELNLFTFGYAEEYPKDYKGPKLIEIKEKLREDVIEALTKPLFNGGVPKIVITSIGQEGSLILEHDSENLGTIDQKFATKTLEYIWDLWTAPVELRAKDDEGTNIAICFDEAGSYIKNLDEDFSFDEEDDKISL